MNISELYMVNFKILILRPVDGIAWMVANASHASNCLSLYCNFLFVNFT